MSEEKKSILQDTIRECTEELSKYKGTSKKKLRCIDNDLYVVSEDLLVLTETDLTLALEDICAKAGKLELSEIIKSFTHEEL